MSKEQKAATDQKREARDSLQGVQTASADAPELQIDLSHLKTLSDSKDSSLVAKLLK